VKTCYFAFEVTLYYGPRADPGQKISCGLAETRWAERFLVSYGRAGLQKFWPVLSLVYTSLTCSQDFWKIFWRVEICSVLLWPRLKPPWVSSSFGSIIFPSSWHPVFLWS